MSQDSNDNKMLNDSSRSSVVKDRKLLKKQIIKINVGKAYRNKIKIIYLQKYTIQFTE